MQYNQENLIRNLKLETSAIAMSFLIIGLIFAVRVSMISRRLK